MTRTFQLESFDLPLPGASGDSVARSDVEEVRLGAYEQGYSAGWDDAVAAQNDEVAHLRTGLGRSLADMTMTYQDARKHVLAAIEPLLQEMVAKVLPAIAHQSLAPMIIEILTPAAQDMSSAPAILQTAPSHVETLERLIADLCPDVPLIVRGEASLSEGQAHLKVGSIETRIDLDGVIDAIARAVSTFFHLEAPKE